LPLPPAVRFLTAAHHPPALTYISPWAGPPAPSPGFPPPQDDLSDPLVGYWTRFARSGDPNSAAEPAWPPYGTTDQFQSLHPSTPTTGTGFATDHKCAFWGLN